MTEELKEFIKIIRDAETAGLLSTSKPMTDYDLAIQYVLGQFTDERGTPCEVTINEVAERLATVAPEFIEGTA